MDQRVRTETGPPPGVPERRGRRGTAAVAPEVFCILATKPGLHGTFSELHAATGLAVLDEILAGCRELAARTLHDANVSRVGAVARTP